MLQDALEQMSPPEQLHTFVCGIMLTQVMYTTAELRLADLVKDGPKSTQELAKATGTDPVNLHRLLRTLVALGVFSEPQPGYVAPTELSAYLQSDHPKTMYHMALLGGQEWIYRTLPAALSSIKSGQPAFERVYGKNLFRYFAEDNPQAGAVFNRSLQGVADTLDDEPLAAAYDFSSIHTLVDVGGGLGSTLITILKRNPAMKGILFDRPNVIEQARAQIAKAGISERVELVAGDFFQEVPRADAYFIKQVVHNWSDEDCKTLLQNCMRAMNPGGKILVVEVILKGGESDLLTKIRDFQLMTIFHGGRDREEIEFRELFASAGLTVKRIIPTPTQYKIVEGIVG